MRRLIVNPGTENEWEIALHSGFVTLGRAPGNSCVLDHPSVADQHCELRVMDSGVTIRDLGSTTGTFIDEQPSTESILLPGQTLRLGEVRLQLEKSPVPVRVVSVPGNTRCKIHPRNPARCFCPKCQGNFFELCINTRAVGGESKQFCRACGVECAPVQAAPAEPAEAGKSFAAQIPGAFKYPFQGDGLVLICAGTLMLLLLDAASFIARHVFLIGSMIVLGITVIAAGYLTAFLRRVLTASAEGEEEMPDWPMINDYMTDVVSPFLQLIGTILFCFAPTIALTIYAGVRGEAAPAWIDWALLPAIALSCFYFPMAFTAVAMSDSIAGVNPMLVIPSILRTFREYTLTVVVLAAILGARWLLERYLRTLVPIPLLPTIITSLIGLYLLVVEMRILGLLYRNKKDELAWY